MAITKDNAVLVRVKLSILGVNKADVVITNEVKENHKMESDAGVYIKKIISRSELSEIFSAFNVVYNVKKTYTLPWVDGNIRVLPSKAFDSFTKDLQAAINKVNDSVDKFISGYDDLKKSAKKRLTSAYIESEFPTREEIRKAFGVSVSYFPVPDKKDFRVADKEMVKNFEADMSEQQKIAQQEIWARFQKVIGHLHNRLKTSDDGFRQSLVDNIIKVAELAKVLNMDDDQRIEDFRKEVEKKFSKLDADQLKEKSVRNKTEKETKELLAKLENYM